MSTDERRRPPPPVVLRRRSMDHMNAEFVAILRHSEREWQEHVDRLRSAGLDPRFWSITPLSSEESAFAEACAARGGRAVFWQGVPQAGLNVPPVCLEADGTVRWATEEEWPTLIDETKLVVVPRAQSPGRKKKAPGSSPRMASSSAKSKRTNGLRAFSAKIPRCRCQAIRRRCWLTSPPAPLRRIPSRLPSPPSRPIPQPRRSVKQRSGETCANSTASEIMLTRAGWGFLRCLSSSRLMVTSALLRVADAWNQPPGGRSTS